MKLRDLRTMAVLLMCAFFLIGVASFASYRYWIVLGPLPRKFPAAEEARLKPFLENRPLSRSDYDGLEAYFQSGLSTYLEPNRSLVRYPGLPSNHGYLRDRVEGFSRSAPLLAVWLRGNHSPDSEQARQARRSLIDGITNGTNPASAGYWGTIGHSDQLIVEASDIALTIWMIRDSIWPELPLEVRNNAINWLLQVNGKRVPDQNWHLFVTYVNLVVHSLGYQADMENAWNHYARFKQFYRGDGWFSDGPGMRFDYYNAWGIHYELFWIDQVSPSYDHEFIVTALDQFAGQFQYLVGPQGLPIMGRSICYRMSISTPLILDQLSRHPLVSPGVARRALNETWRYFIRNGGVAQGNITQGYCAADARVLDSYSGPGSCLWGLRSLISALYLDATSAFWTQPEEPLPVEKGDYAIQMGPTGWTVRGTKPELIVIEKTTGKASAQFKLGSIRRQWWDRVTNNATRDTNEEAKYGLREYRSDYPFCDCKR